ncbi:hypothetical protein [Nonomuraea wenchangensis]|uniref:hypothetical protein n=1 Tax=Nonomuraea wenchangensis TaxID=568860 RepID=UPI0037B89738
MEKVAEMALEVAWKDAKAVYLSFDIDATDAGIRARHRLAGTRRPAAPGSTEPRPAGLGTGPGRYRDRGVLTALRLGRDDLPD